MAMFSAALADELSRNDAPHLPAVPRLYEPRQKSMVVALQQNSRKCAHLVMINSPVMAWGGGILIHFYGPDRPPLDDLIKVMDGIA